MANKKLVDFITAENALDGNEDVYIAQGGKTRKTLLQKIKEFVIGTTVMGTTATDVTGAVKELNTKVGNIDVENDGDVASQLNDLTKVITDEGMYKPELLNGWTKYDGVNDRQLKVWKEPNGVVHLQGILKGTEGTTVPGETCVVGRLPVQYRPKHTLNFIVICGNTNFGRISIVGNDKGEESAGQIIYTFGEITWVSFDGISFVADYVDSNA